MQATNSILHQIGFQYNSKNYDLCTKAKNDNIISTAVNMGIIIIFVG
jgi:hypothetical protein